MRIVRPMVDNRNAIRRFQKVTQFLRRWRHLSARASDASRLALAASISAAVFVASSTGRSEPFDVDWVSEDLLLVRLPGSFPLRRFFFFKSLPTAVVSDILRRRRSNEYPVKVDRLRSRRWANS